MRLPNEEALIEKITLESLIPLEFENGVITGSILVKTSSIDEFLSNAKKSGSNTIFYRVEQIDENTDAISGLEGIGDIMEKAKAIAGRTMSIELAYVYNGYAIFGIFKDKEVQDIYEELLIILDTYNKRISSMAKVELEDKLRKDSEFKKIEYPEQRVMYAREKYGKLCDEAFDSTHNLIAFLNETYNS